MADIKKRTKLDQGASQEELSAFQDNFNSANLGDTENVKQQVGQYANRFKQKLANMGAGNIDKPMATNQPTLGGTQNLDYQHERETNAIGRLSQPQARMMAEYGGGEYDTEEAKTARLAAMDAQNQAQDAEEGRYLQSDYRNSADMLGDSIETKRLQAAKSRQQRLMAKLQAMQAGASPAMADPESMTPGKPEVYSTIERRR